MVSFTNESLRRPLHLFPVIKSLPYTWGMRGDCWVRRFHHGEPFDGPAAEAWFLGPHPDGTPTVLVAGTEISLSDLFEVYGVQVLGRYGLERFGKVMSLQAKALSIDRFLSIQGHVPERFALDLHTTRPGVFKDAVAKHEGGVAIEDTSLLLGFRKPNLIRSLGLTYNLFGKLIGSNPLPPGDEEEMLRQFTARTFAATPEQIRDASLEIYRGAESFRESRRSMEQKLLLKARDFYPDGDIGVIFMLLLNMVHLAPGEAITIPAGVLHAYLCGQILEPQMVSDGVYRCGFTDKPTDPELVSRCGTFKSLVPADAVFKGNLIQPGQRRYTFDEFTFRFEMLTKGNKLNLQHRLAHLLVSLDGHGIMQQSGDLQVQTEIAPGTAWLIPADLPVHLTVNGGRIGRFMTPV